MSLTWKSQRRVRKGVNNASRGQALIANLKGLRHSNSLLLTTGIFAGGNFISLIFRLVGGLLSARAVDPSVLGLFNGVGLVLGYAPFLQLGILNGLSRELPLHFGKGEELTAQQLASAAQAWALTVGGLAAVVLLGVSVWQAFHASWQLAAGWGTYALSVFFLFYGSYYLQLLFRTRGHFAKLSVTNTVSNALTLIGVMFVQMFGFYGLCLRSIVGSVANVGMLWHWRPVRVSPIWNSQHLWRLLKIGAPIFGVGQLYGWWVVLDSTLVLKHMGTQGLGLYQLAIIVGTTVNFLPDAVAEIIYPRMAETYGRTGKFRDLLRLARRPIMYLGLGIVPLVFLGWHLIPPVARIVLPKYVDAIPAAQWTLLLAGLSCLTPVNSAFNVVRRQDLYAAAMICGMLTYAAAVFWLNRNGPSLVAFPQAMIIGRIVFVGLCYSFLWHLWRSED